MPKQQLNFRASERTVKQIDDMRKWHGEAQTEVISRAIDQLWERENSAIPGIEKLFSVRVPDKEWMNDISLFIAGSHERGIALMGYWLWKSSPEYDNHSWLEWIKKYTDYGQYTD